MHNTKWKLKVGMILVLLSLGLYGIHFLLFKDMEHILVYGFGDIAFVPLEVFLVSLVIEGFLEKREKRKILEKLNMLIGVFYTRMGLKLLQKLVENDYNKEEIAGELIITNSWTDKEFKNATHQLEGYHPQLKVKVEGLIYLKQFLNKHIDFLTGMLQNPNVMEHQTFTELLSAVFHLNDELNYRNNLEELKQYEIDHFNIDLQRVYKLLTVEWVAYMKYIKVEYPYMFITAMVHNPYDVRDPEEIEEKLMKKVYQNS